MDSPASAHGETRFGDGEGVWIDAGGRASRTVFAMLADGRTHAFTELAAAVAPLERGDANGAVRDALDTLRRAGMRIDFDGDRAVARAVTCLDVDAITALLGEPGRSPSHWDIRVAWSAESTNTALLAAVRAGATDGRRSLWACEIQDGGRGRLGRRWTSATGASLTMSIALSIARPLPALDGVTLVCGLAVRDVLAGIGVDAALKWPNDVLVGGRKLAGILVEAHAAGGRTTLVVGIGINVLVESTRTDQDAPTAMAATDLERCGATTLDRNRLAAGVADALARELSAFEATGFPPFAPRWNAVDAFADRPVVVGPAHEPANRIAGVARGVDSTGALQLDVAGVRQRIIAGDVSLRPLASLDLAA